MRKDDLRLGSTLNFTWDGLDVNATSFPGSLLTVGENPGNEFDANEGEQWILLISIRFVSWKVRRSTMDLGLWRDMASEGSNFSGLLLPKESVSFPWLLTLQQPPDSFPVVAIMHAARKREVWWLGRKWGRKTSPLAQASHQPLLPHLAPQAGEWNKFYAIENPNRQRSTRKISLVKK